MKKKILLIATVALAMLSCKEQAKVETAAKQLIDKNATAETVQLYNALFERLEKGIMLAHQDALAYGHSWYKEEGRSDVKDVTGDYPAVIGWELGHVEIGAEFNLDSVYFSDMKRYIKDTYRRGGVTTCSWHGDNIVTGGTSWDCAQDNVVRSVLPDSVHHVKYLTWLDRVADFFLDLKDDEGRYIPVIFRMYHEHTGDWFWWCARQSTPQEYKKLWIMTVEYLRDKKGVHNLIYAYSPSSVNDEAHFLERYPGDEYVDVVAFDSYMHKNRDDYKEYYMDNIDRNLKIITDYAAKSGKLPVLGETGLESVSEDKYYTEIVYPIISKYKISWVLFWRNAWEKSEHYYMPFPGHPASADLKEFVDKPDILMNENIK